MAGVSPRPTPSSDPLRDVVRRVWGYDTLRPLQHEAMSAAVAGRDALVVMPTGGGKSLCYQAPALLADKPTVVISPLISLMKDQVDSLHARGVPAAFLNSSLTVADRRRVANGLLEAEYKLIFVAPERFASNAFWDLLDSGGIGTFAIDEAHCISHWGHDFRGDYRRLDQLRARYPDATIHAFTATATPRVRADISAQLHLREPDVLVGDFFRPNLTYRAKQRAYGFDDALRAVRQRCGQAGTSQGGIVYCIRRRDVDELTALLHDAGVSAQGYHAGMSDDERTRVQDAFAAGECDVIVATVAFGMGIDRADIRFVIHAALPKSIEHYQQETGRAGRDGKPAECLLLYSGEDFALWKSIINKENSPHAADQSAMLSEMYAFARGITCRHRKLVTYFGQEWTRESCNACDVCQGDIESLPDSTVLAQKIMSAVARTEQRYGAAYICEVLLGALTERVEARGHNELPTFGIMQDYPKKHVGAWIDQLADQELLHREGEYNILKITPAGWRVLRSEQDAKLIAPPASARKRIRAATVRERTKTTTLQRASNLPSARVVAALGPTLNCPSCEFSLIGNTTGTCPECGNRVPCEELGITREQLLRVAGNRAATGRERNAFRPGGASDNSPARKGGVRTPHNRPKVPEGRPTAPPRVIPDGPLDADDRNVFERLRELRREIADEINAPAFVVFSDKTLRAMARAKPGTQDAMLNVHGVGQKKWEAFGEKFLNAIHEATNVPDQ